MNAKGLLDQLLSVGQSALKDGLGKAENQLNIPSQGKERDAMLSGMGKGAAAAGVMALLLGTKRGRALGGTALKVGSLAALGTMAYRAYQDWQGQDKAQPTQSFSAQPQLPQAEADQRSLILLRAMVAAAKADGHIDDAERQTIQEQIQELDLDSQVLSIVQSELDQSADAHKIASQAQDMEQATEIYLVSRLVIDQSNEMEQAYLDELARALQLPTALRNTLEKHLNA